MPTPALNAPSCHMVIGGEFASLGFFHCQLDLSCRRFFVLDVVVQNLHRQVTQSLAVGFDQVGKTPRRQPEPALSPCKVS